jgi:HEAT repeat protein
LLEIAETGTPTARATALGALSRRDVPGLEPLFGMGDDPDAWTREFLCRALGANGDERGAPVLRTILLAPDATGYARTCAATALNKLGHDDGIAALIDLLKAEEMRSDWAQYGSTLMRLTGQQLPATYEAWHKWWVEEGSKSPAPGQR